MILARRGGHTKQAAKRGNMKGRGNNNKAAKCGKVKGRDGDKKQAPMGTTAMLIIWFTTPLMVQQCKPTPFLIAGDICVPCPDC